MGMLLLCHAACLGAFDDFQSVDGVRIGSRLQHIIPELNFSCDGTVTQWKVGLNLENNQEVNLQIWRSVSSSPGDYTRVTEVIYTVTADETIATVSVSMSVMAGDMVGFNGRLRLRTSPNDGLTIYSSGVDPTSSLSGLDTAVGSSPYITVMFGEFFL